MQATHVVQIHVQLVCIERNRTSYLHMNMYLEMYSVKGHRENPVEYVRAGWWKTPEAYPLCTNVKSFISINQNAAAN